MILLGRIITNIIILLSCVTLYAQVEDVASNTNDAIILPSCEFASSKYLRDQLRDNHDSINLANHEISDECGASIVGYISKLNVPIIALSMNNNNLSDKTAQALYEWLRSKQTTLQVLNLSYNSFSAEKIALIGQGIQHNDTLRELYFAGNHLGDMEDKQIQDFIKAMSSLYIIDISNNNLLSSHMPYVADMLNNNSNIIHLSLAYNVLFNEGIKLLEPALVKQTTLALLDLTFVKMGNDGAEGLLAVFDELPVHLVIVLRHNYFSGDIYGRLIKNSDESHRLEL